MGKEHKDFLWRGKADKMKVHLLIKWTETEPITCPIKLYSLDQRSETEPTLLFRFADRFPIYQMKFLLVIPFLPKEIMLLPLDVADNCHRAQKNRHEVIG